MQRLFILSILMLALPGLAVAADSTELINGKLPPTVVKAPGFPYRAKGLKDGTTVRIKLKQRSRSKNQITDDEEWFHRNVLPRPRQAIHEDFRYVPRETRWGKLKHFQPNGEGRYIGIYEQAAPREEAKDDPGFGSIYDKEFSYVAVLFDGNYAPVKLMLLKGFHPSILEMSNARFVGDTLYFDCNYNGYASIAKKKTGYLVALDVEQGKVLWTTKRLTANYPGFLVYKDVVIAGYGFTAEPDNLFVLNRHTGKVLQTIKLKSAHDYLIPKEGKLYVRTYDHDYVFELKEK